MIGVFSPKGGVGKTTIATNIAIGLGKIAPMSVVIVDLDLQFGDVASGLYLNPEHTVTDAVSPAASQDTLVLKAFLTVHPGGIYAVCAPDNPVDADEITPEQVTRLLEQLAEEFQYVVVDTAPGLPEIGLAAMEPCTDVVWVSAMDIPSVRGLRSGLDVLRQLDILPESRHVVLNMADPSAGSRPGRRVHHRRTRGCQRSAFPRRGLLHQPRRSGPAGISKDPAIKGLNQLVERSTPLAGNCQRRSPPTGSGLDETFRTHPVRPGEVETTPAPASQRPAAASRRPTGRRHARSDRPATDGARAVAPPTTDNGDDRGPADSRRRPSPGPADQRRGFKPKAQQPVDAFAALKQRAATALFERMGPGSTTPPSQRTKLAARPGRSSSGSSTRNRFRSPSENAPAWSRTWPTTCWATVPCSGCWTIRPSPKSW